MEYHSGGSLPLLGRPRYCPGANANGANGANGAGGGYLCETGHCCGESGCCTYYYELWWFWLLWTVLILFSCCCAYRHRRAKLRVQQQQRQRDISLLAYQGASSFPSSMLDLSFLASLKLPSYEEVAAQPSTPPPPYSSVFTAPRYPQPPRSAHPHLLSQHPGAPLHPGAPHRALQALSDGPSSLSSDNSSSCSCDSCCPSSPCSSSLSAPVTYETDTSHASTPSEAMPLALDPVAVETISAAAARLGSSVAILIERSDAAREETVANASPNPDAKQEPGATEHSTDTRTLENTSFKPPRTLSLLLDSVGGNTDTNPSLVPISVSPQNPPKTEPSLLKTSPATSPAHRSSAPRTAHSPNTPPNVDDRPSPRQGTAQFSSKPAAPSPEFTSETPNATNRSEGTEYSQKSPSITSETASQAPVCPLEDHANRRDTFSLNKQTSELSKSSETVATNADGCNDKAPVPVIEDGGVSANLDPSNPARTSNRLPVAANPATQQTEHLAEAPRPSDCVSIAMPDPSKAESDADSPSRENVTSSSPFYAEIPPSTQTAPKASSVDVLSPTMDQETLNLSVTNVEFEQTTSKSQPVDSKLLILDQSSSDLISGKAEQTVTSLDARPFLPVTSSLHFYTEIPPSMPQTAAKASSTFDHEPGTVSPTSQEVEQNMSKSEVLTLDQASSDLALENGEQTANSFFPAITIQADPPSFATSPCSIPSPQTPPQSPPAAMLLLQPSDRSAGSSGHASSLSPSPRNTQSPPKQTLFSPCVDVFEPVDPTWDEEEAESDCEDSDVAADESQYRHRRLTGDSGIEVGRGRVEDEEDEDEEEEDMDKAKARDAAANGAELHDGAERLRSCDITTF